MKDFIKISSLVANLLLVILLGISFAWIYKAEYRLSHSSGQLATERTRLYEEFIIATMMADRLLGLPFPRLALVDVYNKNISTDFSQKEGALILVFDPQTCQPCLIAQLKLLNHVYKQLKNPDTFPVIAIAPRYHSQLIKRYALKYELQYTIIADKKDQIFNDNNEVLYKATPAVYLVNQNNTIIRSHIPVFRKPYISVLFFYEVQNLIPLSEPIFSYIEPLLLIDVVKGDFDLEPIEYFLY